jgi:hypothetical protein
LQQHVTNSLSDRVSFVGFSQPWVVMLSLPSTTAPLAHASMPIDPTGACMTPTFQDVPLAARFDVSQCGRVEFSSVHAYTGTGYQSGHNQNLIDYLILLAGACSP